MILQDVDEKMVLMPAWPKEWNCDFKLYAKQNTIIQGEIVNGTIQDLEVFPKERKKDLYLGVDLKVPDKSIWK